MYPRQCKAITNSGTQCNYAARAGYKFCGKHQTIEEKKQMDKKTRNDENIKQVLDVLYAAGYHCGRAMVDANDKTASTEYFVGPGRVPVIAVEYYRNDDGFEVFVPLVQTNRMDETLYALRDATNAPKEVIKR